MVFSLSLPAFTVLYFDYKPYHFFIRQAAIGGVGIFLMWWISRWNPEEKFIGNLTSIEALGFFLFLGSFATMAIMPFLPASLVPETGGARRWIRLGGFSLSPVEFFKIGFAFFLAWSFNRKIDNSDKSIGEEFRLLIPYIVLFFIAVVFVAVLQKDFGQAVVLTAVLMIMATFAGTSKKLFAIGGLLALLGAVVAIVTQPHRIRRVQSWWATNQDFVLSFFPDSVASALRVADAEEPYQITHSLNAIYHGGFFGVGLGNGTFKLGFLSEVHTDFVLSGIAEEVGFIGILVVSGLMIFAIFRILKISSRAPNKVFHLFCLGVGTIISLSFLINAFGVTSITPVKGIAVPFLSYGGSSILATCIGVGMVLAISKRTDLS